ncbi:hypothetical protein D1007_34219 [Hordeum vulgare]|nr:hypothetical protein D1007_34219 [Hordeum vulgare]
MEQDVALNNASSDPTSSSIVSHFCLTAKASKVSPTLNPNISHDDDVDDNEDEDKDEESDDIASLKIKGEMIFKSLYKNKHACSNFMEIMDIATEGKKYIQELEDHLEEHDATIERMEDHERDYANEIAELSQALENEQTTKESLEETFALELSRLKESHDRDLEVANDFRTKNDKLEVAHAKLLEDYEHLENGSRAIKSSLIELTKSRAQFEVSYAKELAKLPSPLIVVKISFPHACLDEGFDISIGIPPLDKMAGIVNTEFSELAQTRLNYMSWSSDYEIWFEGTNFLRAIDASKTDHGGRDRVTGMLHPEVVFLRAVAMVVGAADDVMTSDIEHSRVLLFLPCCSVSSLDD